MNPRNPPRQHALLQLKHLHRYIKGCTSRTHVWDIRYHGLLFFPCRQGGCVFPKWQLMPKSLPLFCLVREGAYCFHCSATGVGGDLEPSTVCPEWEKTISVFALPPLSFTPCSSRHVMMRHPRFRRLGRVHISASGSNHSRCSGVSQVNLFRSSAPEARRSQHQE